MQNPRAEEQVVERTKTGKMRQTARRFLPGYILVEMSMDKVIVTVEQHGNTSAASVPMALDAGVRDGRVKRGDLILLEAFGGGLTWGSALIRY